MNLKSLKIVVQFLSVSAIVMVTGYMILVGDTENALEKEERKRSELIDEYRTKRNFAENLEDYQQQLSILRQSFSELSRALPDSATQSEIHADMAELAQVSAIELRKFNFDKMEQRGFYAELIYNFQLESDFKSIFSFIEDFYAYPRIGTILRLRIRPYGNNLRADFRVKFYRFLSEEEL